MKVLVSGASGFIGAPLCAHLIGRGHTVVRLVRQVEGADSISWDPEKGTLVKEDFEGFDSVIHLAGEPLSFSRWNQKKRQEILFSRTVSTWLLSHVLPTLLHPPQLFLSASAIGFFGNRGDELLDEESVSGKGFLAHVCREWETAANVVESRGVRTVRARFGMVLDAQGGALKKMAPLFRLGLGAKWGDGMQWMSWIALSDLIHGIEWILSHESIVGSVNFVSPHPVRQKEFCKTLAQELHRPCFLSLPAWLLRLGGGVMAKELLLSSIRAEPKRLLDSGFSFRYPRLEEALRSMI